MLDVSVIYPTPPNAKIKEAKEKMLQLLKKYPIDIIAIGNGTASRESKAFVAAFIREYHLSAAYTIVSEAGASVYSASSFSIHSANGFKPRAAASLALVFRFCWYGR